MTRVKTLSLVCAILLAATALPAINIRLQAYPYEVVADGRSTINITVEVRNDDGSTVPNGTQVLLTTSLGNFREQIVSTLGGRAQATLIAGNVPGIAKITASEINNQTNPSVLEVQFVSSKSKLRSADDFLQITVPSRFEYLLQKKILTGSDLKDKVTCIYRDTQIICDDIQYALNENELRAKNATMSINKRSIRFSDLFLNTKTGRGYGITTIDYRPPTTVAVFSGRTFYSFSGNPEDGLQPVKSRKRVAIVEISPTGIKPITSPIEPDQFDFKKTRFGDIQEYQGDIVKADERDFLAISMTATRLSIVQNRDLQFQNVKVKNGDQTVWTQGLMSISSGGFQGDYPMQEWFTITDSQLGVNYPYFIGLGRQSTNAIRFRAGQSYGRGFNVNRGVFLDYETNWTSKSESNGNFTFAGMGRDDYTLTLRQQKRLDQQTLANFYFDSPQLNSLSSTATVSQSRSDLQLSLNLTDNRNFSGPKNSIQDAFLVAERNPTRIKNTPWQMFYGTQMSYRKIETEPVPGLEPISIRQALSAQLRFASDPVRINAKSTIVSGLTLGQPIIADDHGLLFNATISYSKYLGAFNTNWLYQFARDGQTETQVGFHRLTNQLNYNVGAFGVSLLTQASLDVQRLSLFGSADYRLAQNWRTSLTYTYNKALSEPFVDYNLVLAYRINRDSPFFGLAYSKETNRIGFVYLGGGRF